MEILTYPSTRLREEKEIVKNSEILTDSFRRKCWEMLRKMEEAGGIGLAANQVDWDARVFVMLNTDGKRRVIINPSYTPITPLKHVVPEGCLSFPDEIRYIERYKDIRILYSDLTGSTRHEIFTGLDAQIVQHETNHLDGITLIDHGGEKFTRKSRTVL